jgi:D-hydroxyproline dehydrogenase subunit beta
VTRSCGVSEVAEQFDALIVGAGIVGCACARELTGQGLRVGVIEEAMIGSGATAAGMGHIVVMDDSPAQLALTRFGRLLWDAEASSAGVAHDYRPSGTLWIAASPEEMPAAEAKRQRYADSAVRCQVLTAAACAAEEPALRPGLAGGLLVPDDSVAYPPQSAAALFAAACEGGATLVRGRVVALTPDGVELAGGRIVRGRVIIVANGERSVDLLPELPVVAKKGHLAITDRAPGLLRHQLVELGYLASAHALDEDSTAFNVQPRPTGQVLIGSSRQPGSTSREVDYGILGRMLARACAFLPALERLPCLRVWTGLRAATPDGLPLVGPHPWRSGVWLATGHEGLGITTALATAKLLTAQLCGGAPDIPVAPYLPRRLPFEPAHAS